MNLLKNSNFWLPVWICSGLATLLCFILWKENWPIDTIIWHVGISLVLLIIGNIIGNQTISNYPTKVGLFIYALFMGIFVGTTVWYLEQTIAQWTFSNDASFLLWHEKSKYLRLLLFCICSAWSLTQTSIDRKTKVLEEKFRTISDAATLHREAELFKLRQQLQPHFLYNSLNSINALVIMQPEKAQEMIGLLSDFLRHSVRSDGKEQIQIEEELAYIESYLAIESIRFGDRLQVKIEKRFNASSIIPAFIIQPLIENAIKYGLYGNIGHVVISIQIESIDDYLSIEISNPFDMNHQLPKGTGFGLEGIKRRLFLMYGRNDLLLTKQHNQEFTTLLKIPQSNV